MITRVMRSESNLDCHTFFVFSYNNRNEKKEELYLMAYKHSKGWYISQLREKGITRHPIELKKLKLYKTYIVRNLYYSLLVEENID